MEIVLEDIETIKTIDYFYNQNFFLELFSSNSNEEIFYISELEKSFPGKISDQKSTLKFGFFELDVNKQNKNSTIIEKKSCNSFYKDKVKFNRNENEKKNLDIFSDIIRQKLTKNIYQNFQIHPIFDVFNIASIVLFINITPSALMDLIGEEGSPKINKNLINYFNLFYLMLIEIQDQNIEKYFCKFAQSIYVNVIQVERVGMKISEIKTNDLIENFKKCEKFEKVLEISRKMDPWPAKEQDLIPEKWKEIDIENSINKLLFFHWKIARQCFPVYSDILNKIGDLEWPFQKNIIEKGIILFA
jgi:hypothetical protein